RSRLPSGSLSRTRRRSLPAAGCRSMAACWRGCFRLEPERFETQGGRGGLAIGKDDDAILRVAEPVRPVEGARGVGLRLDAEHRAGRIGIEHYMAVGRVAAQGEAHPACRLAHGGDTAPAAIV